MRGRVYKAIDKSLANEFVTVRTLVKVMFLA